MKQVESAKKTLDEKDELAILINLYHIHSNLIAANELKRQQASQIYLAIIVAIIASRTYMSGMSIDLSAILVVIICGVWLFTIQYHRNLASAKFKVIGEIEGNFPFRPFAREWEVFKATPHSVELTKIERVLPIALSVSAIIIIVIRNY